MNHDMKSLLLVILIYIQHVELAAQDSTHVTIKQGATIQEVLKPGEIYYFPQFTKGEVFYKGGRKASGKMNYTRLFDEMLFIDGKGDTLAMAEEETIKFIAVGQDTFYYEKGYVRVIADNDLVKLAEKQLWVVVDIRKTGTHNTSTNSTGVTSVNRFRHGDEAMRTPLSLNEDLVLRKETQYFFGDRTNQFVRAGRKGLLRLFSKKERNIESYLKENKIDFENKEDIEKLYQFISQLY